MALRNLLCNGVGGRLIHPFIHSFVYSCEQRGVEVTLPIRMFLLALSFFVTSRSFLHFPPAFLNAPSPFYISRKRSFSSFACAALHSASAVVGFRCSAFPAPPFSDAGGCVLCSCDDEPTGCEQKASCLTGSFGGRGGGLRDGGCRLRDGAGDGDAVWSSGGGR